MKLKWLTCCVKTSKWRFAWLMRLGTKNRRGKTPKRNKKELGSFRRNWRIKKKSLAFWEKSMNKSSKIWLAPTNKKHHCQASQNPPSKTSPFCQFQASLIKFYPKSMSFIPVSPQNPPFVGPFLSKNTGLVLLSIKVATFPHIPLCFCCRILCTTYRRGQWRYITASRCSCLEHIVGLAGLG